MKKIMVCVLLLFAVQNASAYSVPGLAKWFNGTFKISGRFCVDGYESQVSQKLVETGERKSPSDQAPLLTEMTFKGNGEVGVVSLFVGTDSQYSSGTFSVHEQSYQSLELTMENSTAPNMKVVQGFMIDPIRSTPEKIILYDDAMPASSTFLGFWKGISSCDYGKLGRWLVIELEKVQ